MSREISQQIEINNTPEFIYQALLNPSAITSWWQAKTAIVVKENDGIYAVTWGDDIDDPDFITVSFIKNLVPSKSFDLEYSSYVAKSGNLPFDAKMNVYFTIVPNSGINTILEVKQTGIPDDPIANDYFEWCTNGWIQILGNIKNYCEKE